METEGVFGRTRMGSEGCEPNEKDRQPGRIPPSQTSPNAELVSAVRRTPPSQTLSTQEHAFPFSATFIVLPVPSSLSPLFVSFAFHFAHWFWRSFNFGSPFVSISFVHLWCLLLVIIEWSPFFPFFFKYPDHLRPLKPGFAFVAYPCLPTTNISGSPSRRLARSSPRKRGSSSKPFSAGLLPTRNFAA